MTGRCCACDQLAVLDDAEFCPACRARIGEPDDPLWSDLRTCPACGQVTRMLIATLPAPLGMTCPRCGQHWRWSAPDQAWDPAEA